MAEGIEEKHQMAISGRKDGLHVLSQVFLDVQEKVPPASPSGEQEDRRGNHVAGRGAHVSEAGIYSRQFSY